ncbi:MAG: hypothetical protein ACRDTZ_07630 [Pseudonocardiaceae bacterium]
MTESTSERIAWWADLAGLLDEFAEKASEHLPTAGDDAIDFRDADGVVDALAAARNAATLVVGAYSRVIRKQQAPPVVAGPQIDGRPAPAAYAPQTRGWS